MKALYLPLLISGLGGLSRWHGLKLDHFSALGWRNPLDLWPGTVRDNVITRAIGHLLPHFVRLVCSLHSLHKDDGKRGKVAKFVALSVFGGSRLNSFGRQ